MSEKKITRAYRLHSAQQLYESVDEAANTAYYLFVAKNTSYPEGDSTIEAPEDTDAYESTVFRDMQFGKRITSDDMAYVVPRHEWDGNTVYAAYDNDDSDLFDKTFYTVVNAASYYHVWKCLYNNGNTVASVEPSIDALSANDNFFETSDGYQWKYMTSVPANTVSKFATVDFFPIISNTEVEDVAVDGAIDVINVVDGGNNFGNYVAGNNQFSAAQIRLSGNGLLYDISSNSTTSSSNDYYNGCYIYITAGAASEIGQYRKIVDYIVNSTAKAIVLESAFSNAISITSSFDIYPGVIITGTGTETSNAVARAIVNSVGNVIHRIEMLTSGSGYEQAEAIVYAYPDVGASNATLKVVGSPPGGHGANPFRELGSTALAVSVNISNTEGNTILQSNDYRTIGLLKDPIFSQVDILVDQSFGLFLSGEEVIKLKPILLARDGVVSSSSTTLQSDLGDFENQFVAGDMIYLSDSTIDAHWLAVVNSITNSTSLELTSNCGFTSNVAFYHIPRTSTNGTITTSNSTIVQIIDVIGDIDTGDLFVGTESGAALTVNSISRAGVSKGFDTFVATYKYVGSIASGEFQEDEIVYQNSLSTANGTFHSTINDGTNDNMYVTDQFGTFSVGTTIRGSTSNALFTVTQIYGPEIVFRSGDILYMENISPVTRAPDQQENFKLIFEF